jgi:hypothetical protein
MQEKEMRGQAALIVAQRRKDVATNGIDRKLPE